MSLTTNDLDEIRKIVESSLATHSELVIKPLENEITAIRNDIKDIYDMIAELQNKITPDTKFQNLSIEQKLLKLNSELLIAAKQAGVTLPR